MCECSEGLDPLAFASALLGCPRKAFILPSANPWLNAFLIRNSGIQGMRMSLDMTDIIIAFTANRAITGFIQNNIPRQENRRFCSYVDVTAGVRLKQKVADQHRGIKSV